VKRHLAKLKKLNKNEGFKKSYFSRANLTVFAIVFAAIGGYLIYSTFAAPPANCFTSPGACGYPDPAYHNVGVPQGTVLTPSGSITASTPGQVIQNLDINGTMDIKANNVTVKNVRVTMPGPGCGPVGSASTSNSGCGTSWAIHIENGVTNTLIEDSELTMASGYTGEYGVHNDAGGGTTASTNKGLRLYIHDIDGSWWGPGDIEESYFLAEGLVSGDHVENIYYGGGAGPLIVNHNTMYNPVDQTATVFTKTDFGNITTLTETNNFLVGGGYTLYGGTSGTGTVVGPVTVTNNRFARCLTTEVNTAGGGHACTGGPDSHGYWPRGGNYGLAASFSASTTWTGNFWDDSPSTAICMGGTAGCGPVIDPNPNPTPPPPPPSSDTTPPTVSLTAPTAGSTVSGASVALSANASDNVSVSSVQFRVDGSNVSSADTSSPYSVTWDSRTAGNGTHTITAVATDSSGNSTTSSSVSITTNNTTSCSTSSTTWQNNSFAAQTGNFTFDFDATPNAANIDTVTGLSSGSATGYSSLGVIARFNSSGTIDAVNDTGQTSGGNYTSVTSIPYTAGTSYHFKLTVNPGAHTYSATVTPAGGSAQTLATNYGFRLEQANLSSFNNWALYGLSGTHSVCGATVAAVATGPKNGDINGDNSVNITDLSLLLSSYNQNTTQCTTNNTYKCDLSSPGDGVVNIFDLSILLSHYGT
jgi:hypothetical protein